MAGAAIRYDGMINIVTKIMTITMAKQFIRIGLVSISDRASSGVYEDKGIPALKEWLDKVLTSPWEAIARVIPDEQPDIESTLRDLVDHENCGLVLTTGGTGPALRDVTPEATLAVADKVMPGFGEQMRQISLHFVATAILSRQVAVIRKQSLIINLPGQPKSIAQTLEGLKDEAGNTVVHGIFAAVPYCLDLIGAPYIETDETIVKAFRPKSAQKPAG
jgi:molybdopterin adenylyltransferase